MYFRNYSDLIEHLENLQIKDTESLMILVGDESEYAVSDMMDYLKNRNINFFGGIYSGLLVGNRNERTGFIVKKFEPVYSSLVFPFMMKIQVSPEDLRGCTALILVDGLSSQMQDLIDTVYNKLEGNVKYIGGGAGFYNMTHKPCIFNNNGIFKDVLHVCIIKSDVSITVEHGWKKLEGPFFVKRSRDNVLSQLDYSSAFDVYKHVIEGEENMILSKEDFFMFAKDHPFGIDEGNGEVIVRDPISVNENNEIVCVANIPEGSDVYVLKGDCDLLLDSSRHIAEKCTQNAPEEYMPFLF